jgi:Na+/pantothenate symporter
MPVPAIKNNALTIKDLLLKKNNGVFIKWAAALSIKINAKPQ